MSDVNEADPESAVAYDVRGLAYMKEGRDNMAIADLDRERPWESRSKCKTL